MCIYLSKFLLSKFTGIPVTMKEFLEYCGCSAESFGKEDKKKKETVLLNIARQIQVRSENYAEVTGFDKILRSSAMKERPNFEKPNDNETNCNKGQFFIELEVFLKLRKVHIC